LGSSWPWYDIGHWHSGEFILILMRAISSADLMIRAFSKLNFSGIVNFLHNFMPWYKNLTQHCEQSDYFLYDVL